MKILHLFAILLSVSCAVAQADPKPIEYQHPYIWATMSDRPEVLARIQQSPGLGQIVAQVHDAIDEEVDKHTDDPGTFLGTIPPLKANIDGHRHVFDVAVDSAVLYYLTQDPKYAQFSADILGEYIAVLSKLDAKSTTIMGPHFENGRWAFGQFALTYDFIYPFLKQPGTMVYDRRTKQRVAFDLATAQTVLHNLALSGLQEWGPGDQHGRYISNWHLLTASGDLYPLLCVDDAAERDRLFDIYWDKGTQAQASMKYTIVPMMSKFGQGIWPESTSYGNLNPLGELEQIDRLRPDLHAITDNLSILQGRFLLPQLGTPDGRFVRYGDAKRDNGNSKAMMHQVRDIAFRYGLTDLQQRAESYMKLLEDGESISTAPTTAPAKPTTVPAKTKPAARGRAPKKATDVEGYSLRGLFLKRPPTFDPSTVKQAATFARTVVIKHAGVALVRNYVEKDNATYGLCGYIGGGHYVHSHCTGIAMELYGVGDMLATGGGLPPSVKERADPIHTDYYRLYAGANTVVVNGTSHGREEGAWRDHSNLWQNTAENIAAEPGHLEEAVSKDFGFATQSLNDTVNNCRQERTLAAIRTSETTGYYFDMFRSRSMDLNKFHDYIYHNLGDEMVIADDQAKPLPLAPTDRYQNDVGDIVHSPGWRYFEKTASTDPTDTDVRVTFKLNEIGRYMHLSIPGGVQRQYTQGTAPPTREAKNGYDKKRTPVLVIRQPGEAWDHPYLVIFEPSTNINPTVVSVKAIQSGTKVVGAEVVSKLAGKTISDVLINQDSADTKLTLPDRQIEFTGRFAIIRTERGQTPGEPEKATLYIGDGTRLEFNHHVLEGNEKRHGFVNAD